MRVGPELQRAPVPTDQVRERVVAQLVPARPAGMPNEGESTSVRSIAALCSQTGDNA
jgi:hypothetical protein